MIYRVATALLILCGLGACALVADQRAPQEIVAERAAKHLNLLHQGQWADALELTTPGFRSKTTPEQYSARYGGVWMWQSTRIGTVTCEDSDEPASCDVQTYLTFLMPPLMTVPSEHYKLRTWIKVGSGWYVYEP